MASSFGASRWLSFECVKYVYDSSSSYADCSVKNSGQYIFLFAYDVRILLHAMRKNKYSFCRYPRYQFIHERNISQSANLKTRETLTALRGLLIDIYTLVSCDFIVCTFSSRVCIYKYSVKCIQNYRSDKKIS